MTAQLSTSQVRHAWFVEFHFLSETSRVWTGFRNITQGGYDWTPVGPRGVVESIEDPLGEQAPSLSLRMSGVDTTILALALAQTSEVRGQLVFIYDLYFDEDWQPIGSLETYAVARMDTLRITKSLNGDGSYDRVLEVPAEYLLTTGANPPYGRYSAADQTQRHPGQTDLYFEFMGQNQNKRIRWPDY